MLLRLTQLLFLLSITLNGHTQTIKFPVIQPEVLKAKYELDYWGKLELSGIVKSRTDKNVFWIHDDSGDEPRVFAVDSYLQTVYIGIVGSGQRKYFD